VIATTGASDREPLDRLEGGVDLLIGHIEGELAGVLFVEPFGADGEEPGGEEVFSEFLIVVIVRRSPAICSRTKRS